MSIVDSKIPCHVSIMCPLTRDSAILSCKAPPRLGRCSLSEDLPTPRLCFSDTTARVVMLLESVTHTQVLPSCTRCGTAATLGKVVVHGSSAFLNSADLAKKKWYQAVSYCWVIVT